MATPSPTPTPTPHNQTAPTMPGGSDSSTDEFEDDDDGLFYWPEESDSIDGFQDDDNFFYFPDGEFDEPGATPAPRATPAPVAGRSQPHTPMPAVVADEDEDEVDCVSLLSPEMSVSQSWLTCVPARFC